MKILTNTIKTIGSGMRVTHKVARTGHALAVNPLEFFIDTLISIVASIFIPIPILGSLVGSIIAPYKKVILYLLASAILLPVFITVMVMTVVLAPRDFLSQLPNLSQITKSLTGNAATWVNNLLHGNLALPNSGIPITGLNGYIEAGFTDTDIPNRDPFGGNGLTNSQQTAGFHDQAYFNTYGVVHEGVDLIPTNAYYQSNKAYGLTKQVIMFATNSGTARDYTDSYGALTVDITNKEGTLLTEYKHLKQFIMQDGVVHAGQPVGVMGATGFAFGEHLHYQIEVNQGGSWVPVNPESYLPN
jgi:hypothetical protein